MTALGNDPHALPGHPGRAGSPDDLGLTRLVVQGTGFNWPRPDHLRIVTLPRVDDLTEAIGRIGTFLETYRAAG